MNIHPVVKEISAIFSNQGKQVYLVGGAVRDLLRSRKAKDWDLATDALPDEVIAFFKEKSGPGGKPLGFVIPTGIKHGTVTVHFRGNEFEVTTFRADKGYSDGRRPDTVEFGVSIDEDLARRDFTMNAAAYKLPEGPLTDPFNGCADIKAKLIRSVGNPVERFAEDGLRPVRAMRFASQLGFQVDDAVLAAIPAALPLTAKVAPERMRDELDKIIMSPEPSAAFLLMEKTGLLELILPDLAACRGVDQKGFHRFDVLEHSLLACDFAARENAPREVRLAAIFHDLGKKTTRKLGDKGVWTFHQHEEESSRLAKEIMLNFRYPNAVMDKVCHLIEEHMFHYEDNWTDAAVRRFIIRAGEEDLPDLYALRRADAYGTAKTEPAPDFLLPLTRRVEKVLAGSRALSLKDLAVTGYDLKEAHVKPGKHMGIILNELLEAVIDDPSLNTREKLIQIAANINERYSV
ncbi:CCA tRNA nucleotidyltransferase [Leadbettera azotonutricia]|uniref:tRNA adenylyltransferase n=1 Tax=Leadbettera azotonutricia (strain ATCC BAA-888 / DSM 13862 / ZAS-9) TaxID=545695 RepID=F5Y8J3_LEAAZ|nr:CCA tRNA nucleotidyltransferase [Leadbettera azotonutricia]AEF80876.1 tRNA adenylyltransferase [Leadbettera azotonutricia ZAS-9]